MTLDHAAGFYLPWSAALAAAVAEPARVAGPVLAIGGVEMPIAQSVLAVAGVLLARPLARKKEAALPIGQFVAVSAILVLLALAWVSEARPGVLFAFVVAIGLGFSGYSLIEAAGDQVGDFFRRVIDKSRGGKE